MSRNMRNVSWSLLSLSLLGTALGRAEEKPVRPPVAADTKFVGNFLDNHCASCHDAYTKSGEFALHGHAYRYPARSPSSASSLSRS